MPAAARRALAAAALCAAGGPAAAAGPGFRGAGGAGGGAGGAPIVAVFQRFVLGDDSLLATAPLLRAFAAEYGGRAPAGARSELLLELLTAGGGDSPAPRAGRAVRPPAAPDAAGCLVSLAGAAQALPNLEYSKVQASADCAGAGYAELACAADVIDFGAQAAGLVENLARAAFDCGGSNMACAQTAASTLQKIAEAAGAGVAAKQDCRNASHAPWICKSDAVSIASRLQAAVGMAQATQAVCGTNSTLGAWASSLLGHPGEAAARAGAVDLGKSAGLALQSVAHAVADAGDANVEGKQITAGAVEALLGVRAGLDALVDQLPDVPLVATSPFQRELLMYSARLVRTLSAALKALRLAQSVPNA